MTGIQWKNLKTGTRVEYTFNNVTFFGKVAKGNGQTGRGREYQYSEFLEDGKTRTKDVHFSLMELSA